MANGQCFWTELARQLKEIEEKEASEEKERAQARRK